VICRLTSNQRLSRNVNLSNLGSRIHRAGSIIGLIGELSTSQLNHAEQVVDIALILQFQIEVVTAIPDRYVYAGYDDRVASLGNFQEFRCTYSFQGIVTAKDFHCIFGRDPTIRNGLQKAVR